MILHRRGLLVGLASVLAAPAIVPYTSLMPVKAALLQPEPYATTLIGGQMVTYVKATRIIVSPLWMHGRRVSLRETTIDYGAPRHGEAAYNRNYVAVSPETFAPDGRGGVSGRHAGLDLVFAASGETAT